MELIKIHKGHAVDRENLGGFQEEAKILPSTGINDEEDDIEDLNRVDLDQVASDSSDGEQGLDDSQDHGIQEENDVGYVKKRTFSCNLGNSTEASKKIKGLINTNENDEESRVAFNTYRRYLGYVGGIKQFIMTNICLVAFIVLKVMGDYLVGHWATAEDQHSRFGYYCGVYFFILFWQSVFVYLRVLSLTYYSFHGTR